MTATITRSYDQALRHFADEVGPEGPVAVVGGRTRWERGGRLDDHARLVEAPSGIVDYQPAEMTVRVRAGTTMAELNRVLAAEGQRTALPCRSAAATVGGALAVGENDLDVLGRGRARDALLQVTYVSAEGRLITGGGPTVKNVSGFNLPRLLVGSLGTLGLLAEVILRTNPVPPAERWLTLRGPQDPQRWASEVFGSLVRPAAVLHDGRRVWVHLEGHLPDVDAQHAVLDERWAVTVADGPPPLPPHRWSLSPLEAATFDRPAAGSFVAQVGVGLVLASAPPPERPDDPVRAMISDRVKHEFDPTGRLNPGRRP